MIVFRIWRCVIQLNRPVMHLLDKKIEYDIVGKSREKIFLGNPCREVLLELASYYQYNLGDFGRKGREIKINCRQIDNFIGYSYE